MTDSGVPWLCERERERETPPGQNHTFTGWWKGSTPTDKTLTRFAIVDALAKVRVSLDAMSINLSGYDILDGDTLVFPVHMSSTQVEDSRKAQHARA